MPDATSCADLIEQARRSVFLWKFRANFSPMLEENGRPLRTNPYSSDATVMLMERIRLAHGMLFEVSAPGEQKPPSPIWVEVDRPSGRMMTQIPRYLLRDARKILASDLQARYRKTLHVEADRYMAGLIKAVNERGQRELKLEPDPDNP